MSNYWQHIGGIMVSMLGCHRSWVRVPVGSNQRLYIGICCFSAKHAALRRKNKTGWLGIRTICPSAATCLPADCCVSELTLIQLVGLVQSGLHRHRIEN